MKAVFWRDCSCEPGTFELFASDKLAMERAWWHWQCRIMRDDNHRYWRVHGPSGHVIALHDTPYGRFPPPP